MVQSFTKVLGELPIIEQATISIWMSEQSMRDYAYSDKNHLKIINKARKDKWYSEELFVRSNILSLKELIEKKSNNNWFRNCWPCFIS